MWILKVRPSNLDEVYWTHTYDDLRTIVRLNTQFEVAKVYQAHESFRLVVAEALGAEITYETPSKDGGKDGGALQTFADLARAFSEVGGSVG